MRLSQALDKHVEQIKERGNLATEQEGKIVDQATDAAAKTAW